MLKNWLLIFGRAAMLGVALMIGGSLGITDAADLQPVSSQPVSSQPVTLHEVSPPADSHVAGAPLADLPIAFDTDATLTPLKIMTTPAYCFLAQEGVHTFKKEGDCDTRYSPASTFKIPLALMGFNSGVFVSKSEPRWTPPAGTSFFINAHKGPHTPATWMRDSAVWYSQELTTRLGMERFQNYVAKFAYGNQDVSGTPGKGDGLTEAWLMSSLQISAQEQVDFLQKLVDRTLPVSQKAYDLTRAILYREELWGGWKLYGKTGGGTLQDAARLPTSRPQGWFVGWIEKSGRHIVFAGFVSDTPEDQNPGSLQAMAVARQRLFWIINDIEK